MKIYVYDFSEGHMEDPSLQGNGTGICCYDNDSVETVKTSKSLDHTDMSLFGRTGYEGTGAISIPFFGGGVDVGRRQSIGFGDLLISDFEGWDLDDEMNGY